MNYYKYKDKLLFSRNSYQELSQAAENELIDSDNTIYYLKQITPSSSRRGYKAMSAAQLEATSEGLQLLERDKELSSFPHWINEKISLGKVKCINTSYPTWKDELYSLPKDWRINIIALGDVGSTLAIGLRLLGKNISRIGIHDRNHDKQLRWEYELNQIRRPFDESCFPPVEGISESKLFDCDMFVFCASKGIPPVGSGISDVRMAQFEGNKTIVSKYAKLARDKGFKGIFAVVSDPVDPLCKAVFLESNKSDDGSMDYLGIAPNRIIGFGLGVMNARATFYAEKDDSLSQYLEQGQVFGPHGKGLIVADSITSYNHEKSLNLTDKTVNANMEIRELGFKPYVAPSLSSGSLSIAAAIQGDYFYGSSLMGEIFMGSRMRFTDAGLEVPQYELDQLLKDRLVETYNGLRSII